VFKNEIIEVARLFSIVGFIYRRTEVSELFGSDLDEGETASIS
jgi:hypothetical protein